MSDNIMDSAHCGNHASLVSFLYDECEPGEREAIAAHLAACPACTAEIQALRDTRRMLPAWAPPEAALGFGITSGSTSPLLRAARWWHRPLPAWAQVAAALLIFAAGLLVGGAHSGSPATPAVADGRASVAGQSSREETAVPHSAMPDAAAPPVRTASAEDLSRVERELRTELARLAQAQRDADAARAPLAVSGAPAAAPITRDEVELLIADSERRQRGELIVAMGEVIADVDQRQRRALTPVRLKVEGLGLEWERNRDSMSALVDAFSAQGGVRTVGTGR